jgi:hypothetical protein
MDGVIGVNGRGLLWFEMIMAILDWPKFIGLKCMGSAEKISSASVGWMNNNAIYAMYQ